MTAMHKLLLSRIQASKMARLHLGRTPVQKEGMQAVALDIQNAFSSIPREEILHGLDEAHVPLVLRNYVEARSTPRLGPLWRPLSMMLYCLGQNAYMRQIKALYPNIVASADDIVIFHNDLETDATELARHYALESTQERLPMAGYALVELEPPAVWLL